MMSVPASHVGGGDGGGEANAAADGGGGGGGGVDGQFRLALEHVHRVGLSLHSSSATPKSSYDDAPASPGDNADSPEDKFLLKGGCPFKTFYKGADGSGPRVPFVDAMEKFSLGAIMAAAMAEEEARKKDLDDKKKEEAGAEMLKALAFDLGGPPSEEEQATADVSAEAETLTDNKRDEIGDEGVEGEATSLSAALKIGTAESHSAAESVHFVANFVKGRIDRDLFARLTVALLRAYTALEEELEVHGPAEFPALHHPCELARREALEDDVEFFFGDDWESLKECQPTPATRDYVDRIRYVARTEPLLLLSHAYTRYLGDLSGGRVLMRVARRALNLGGSDDGLRFYKFDNVKSAKEFKDAYRRELDELEMDAERVERLVAEANVAFVLNMRLFEELDMASGVKGASVRDISDATKYYDDVVAEQARRKKSGRRTSKMFSHGEGGDAAKCPFAGLAGAAGTGTKTSASDGADKSEPSAVVGKSLMTGTSGGCPRHENQTTDEKKKEGRCPWPFVFFHDPAAGMRDWQTWAVMGLLICWMWSMLKPVLLGGSSSS